MLFSDDLIFDMLELSLCYNHCIQYRQISGYDRPRCNLLILFVMIFMLPYITTVCRTDQSLVVRQH